MEFRNQNKHGRYLFVFPVKVTFVLVIVFTILIAFSSISYSGSVSSKTQQDFILKIRIDDFPKIPQPIVKKLASQKKVIILSEELYGDIKEASIQIDNKLLNYLQNIVPILKTRIETKIKKEVSKHSENMKILVTIQNTSSKTIIIENIRLLAIRKSSEKKSKMEEAGIIVLQKFPFHLLPAQSATMLIVSYITTDALLEEQINLLAKGHTGMILVIGPWQVETSLSSGVKFLSDFYIEAKYNEGQIVIRKRDKF